MAYNPNYINPKTIHDSEEGDSQIYVGIKYLGIVGQQINEMRIAQKMALHSSEFIQLWLNELRVFYDLVENRTGMNTSKETIKLFKYQFDENNQRLERIEFEVNESEKYEIWFEEIQLMIERNYNVQVVGGSNPFKEMKYLNNKKILQELSKCHRELLRDANKRHLIMPEGVKDMKKQISEEWLDRDAKKEF